MEINTHTIDNAHCINTNKYCMVKHVAARLVVLNCMRSRNIVQEKNMH